MNNIWVYKNEGNHYGKRYELISDNFMFKDNVHFPVYERQPDKQFIEEKYGVKEWRSGLVLYKALYEPCPDGPYFARIKEDFYENFVLEDEFVQKK